GAKFLRISQSDGLTFLALDALATTLLFCRLLGIRVRFAIGLRLRLFPDFLSDRPGNYQLHVIGMGISGQVNVPWCNLAFRSASYGPHIFQWNKRFLSEEAVGIRPALLHVGV